ncbi:MAG TPA: IS5 family transposase [Candidatus Acidoferrales bacterium]|nr:IS5 family transposase [Candidatus Acidoferrales bacterium]
MVWNEVEGLLIRTRIQPSLRDRSKRLGGRKFVQHGFANGCKWRGLPSSFGKWHTVYTRLRRWQNKGVLERVFRALQEQRIVAVTLQVLGLDSTSVKVHPDGAGALKKNGPQAIVHSRGGCTTKIHLVAANERTAVTFSLSPGNAGDVPCGRALVMATGSASVQVAYLVVDKAYEGDETRDLARQLSYEPVVPPKENRREPWQCDPKMYRRRNEVEWLFRRLNGFRRVFTRFEKLDAMYMAVLTFALIVEALRQY